MLYRMLNMKHYFTLCYLVRDIQRERTSVRATVKRLVRVEVLIITQAPDSQLCWINKISYTMSEKEKDTKLKEMLLGET